MNTFDAIINRRSCKNFDPRIEPKKGIVAFIAKSGTFAATGMNRQSPIILVVTNKELRDKIAKKNAEILGIDTDPFYGAPTVIVVLAKKDVSTHVYDGSLVMANMMLTATDCGLGSCWIHRAKETFTPEFQKELGLDGSYEGIGNLVIGYPKGAPRETPVYKEDYIRWYE